MEDYFSREINYLRVSVTDRCNFRCLYCMPPGGINPVSHSEILRNEEILRLIKAAAGIGIKKIRLTGGEPLVRRGIVDLVAGIAKIDEIDDIAITTNGSLLPALGKDLKEAGLRRVNISLDTLEPGLFRHITGNGDLAQVWRGIETALGLGLNPVKINTVLMRGINYHELPELAGLVLKYPLHVRFIELMPVGTADTWAGDMRVSTAEVMGAIESALGRLEAAQKPSGSGPAKYFRLPGAPGTIGFISAVSDHFCPSCNRLRLTAEGMIRPCLYSNREINIKTPLRQGATDRQLAALFREAVAAKPDRHNIQDGWKDEKRNMSQIGG
ncbi:MAG: GTP 3',8-cyclase MoaA [Bacillota bacterium]